RDYHRSDFFTHHCVGHTHHRYFENRWMCRKRVLDFNTINILAAAANHVLFAIDDLNKTLFIDPSHVSGVKPAVDERFGARFGLVPIAAHYVWAANQQLSDAGGLVPLKQIDVDDRGREAYGLRT